MEKKDKRFKASKPSRSIHAYITTFRSLDLLDSFTSSNQKFFTSTDVQERNCNSIG